MDEKLEERIEAAGGKRLYIEDFEKPPTKGKKAAASTGTGAKEKTAAGKEESKDPGSIASSKARRSKVIYKEKLETEKPP